MLQYKIPQDVQIADKIIGPLTLKQLLIVAAGGGISYVIFLLTSESYFLSMFDYFWICIPLFCSLAFAFLKINDVSFLKWILLIYEFNHNARKRRWDKNETARLHYSFVTAKTGGSDKKKKKGIKKAGQKDVPGKKKYSSLEELTQVLDHSSPFEEGDKSLPSDHTADDSLHLTAEEKERHEKRLEKTLQKIAQKKEVLQKKPEVSADRKASPSRPSLPPDTKAPSSDTVPPIPNSLQDTGEVDFSDMTGGGQVSFS